MAGKKKQKKKECFQCHRFKPLDCYHKNKLKKDGFSHLCKVCTKKRIKTYMKQWAKERARRPPTIKEKPCIRCHTIKPTSEFWSSMNHKNGINNVCITCVKKDVTNYRQKWFTERQKKRKPITKLCKVCHRRLPSTLFYETLHVKDGLYKVCKDCCVHYNEELRKRWKEERDQRIVLAPKQKTCSKCHRTLSIAHFYAINGVKDGYENFCKDCHTEQQRKLSAKWKEDRRLNPESVKEKTCPRCQQTHPISEFYPNEDNKDGYSEYCKACHRDLRLTYIEKWEKERQRTHASPKTKECMLCHNNLPISRFYPDKKYRDGYVSVCIKCAEQRTQKYMQQWQTNREPLVEKQCKSCQQILPIEQFRRNKRKKDGYDTFCNDCNRALQERYMSKWEKERAGQEYDSSIFQTTEKTCCICKQTKPLSAFYRIKRSKDGYKSSCKECDKKHVKDYIERIKNTPKIIPEEKVCHSCKKLFPASAFNRSLRTPDGLYIYCKACYNAKQRAYFSRPAARERRKEWNREHQKHPDVRKKRSF